MYIISFNANLLFFFRCCAALLQQWSHGIVSIVKSDNKKRLIGHSWKWWFLSSSSLRVQYIFRSPVRVLEKNVSSLLFTTTTLWQYISPHEWQAAEPSKTRIALFFHKEPLFSSFTCHNDALSVLYWTRSSRSFRTALSRDTFHFYHHHHHVSPFARTIFSSHC